MIKIDYNDLKKMVKMGEDYKEKEERVCEIVANLDYFLHSDCVAKVTFQHFRGYSSTELNKDLCPEKKDLYPCMLRKMNEEIGKLYEEKKALEKDGILISDRNFFGETDSHPISVFEKAKEIKEIIKKELDKLGDDK